MKERRKLPALDNAKQLSTPDLNEVANKNYTDTILRYGNLATHFPQLDTNAKTIVAAINELYHTKSTVIPNPPGETPTDTLNTVKIDGTVFNIEGGGGSGGELSGYETQHYIGTNASNVSQVWDDEAVNTVIQYDFFRYQAIEFPVSTTEEFTFNNDSDIILDADLNFDISIDDEVYTAPGSGGYGLNKDTIFGYEVRFYLIDTTTNTETFISDYTPQEIIYDMDELPTSSYNLYYNRVDGSGTDIDDCLNYYDSYKLTAEIEWGEYHFDGQGDGSSIAYELFTEEDYQGRYNPHWSSDGGCLTTKAVVAEIPKFYYAGNDCIGLTFSASLGTCWGLIDPMYEDPNNQGAVCRCQFTIEYCEVGTDDWQEWDFSDRYNNLLYTWDMKGTPGCRCPEITDNKSFNFTVESQHNIPLETGKEYSLRLCLYFGSYPKDPSYSGSPYELYLYVPYVTNTNSAFTLEYAVAPTVGGSVSEGGDEGGTVEPIGPHRNFYCNLKSVISRDFTKLLTGYIVANKKYRIKTTFSFFANGGGLLSAGVKFNSNKAITRIEGYDEIHNGGGGSSGESYTAGDGIYFLKGNTTSINADAGRFSGMYRSAYYRSEYDSMMRENDWKPASGMYAVYDEFHPDTPQDTFVLSRTPILTAVALVYDPNGQIGDKSYTLTGRTAKLNSKVNPYTTVRIYYTTSEASSGLPVYQTLGHTYDKNSGPSKCKIHCEGYEKLRVFITQDIEECEGGTFNDHEYVVISAPNISVIQDADLGDRDYCEFSGKGKKLTNYYMTDFDRFHTFQGGYKDVNIEYRKDEGIVNTHRAYMFYFLEEYYGQVNQATITGDGVTDTFNIGSPGRLGNILNIFHSYNHYNQAIDLSHVSVIDHTSIKFDYIIPSGESVYIRYAIYPSEGEIFNDYNTNYAISQHAHAEGCNTKALGHYGHTEGYGTYANAYSHAEGNGSKALSDNTSHAEGYNTVAAGAYSHAEGNEAKALGADAHAEGLKTLAYGLGSHAEGNETKAYGDRSHAEGRDSVALSDYAHAEGRKTVASGSDGAHAEGYGNIASGSASHTENYETVASGSYSHAEGYHSEAREHSSHTQGDYTIATGRASHVFGKYNVEDTNEGDYNGYRKYAEIVGNGTDVNARSNARTLDWDGNEWVAGRITVGLPPLAGMDVATKKYVDDHGGGGGGLPSIKAGTGIAAELFNQMDEYNESTASGDYSHAEGISTTASNDGAHAEGRGTEASGKYSHAEGSNTIASDYYAHAEGNSTTASGGDGAHAEGNNTVARGSSAHAEGTYTQANGAGSHAGGGYSIASGQYSYAMGDNCTASGDYSHAEGQTTIANGDRSHAEGYDTTASGNSAHAEGNGTIASNSYTHAEGQNSVASNTAAHAEGYGSTASGYVSHAEGYQTQARATGTHTEGYQTQATQNFAHAEGAYNIASGFESHAEGVHTFATGDFSHSEGQGLEDVPNVAAGDGSHVEGFQSQAIGNASHAEGGGTRAIGQESHSEGAGTWAYGKWSHAEGAGNHVFANYSHVEGAGVDVIKEYSHAEGAGNKCIGQYNHIEGGGNVSTNHMSHTEGAGNTNDGVQAHAEGSGNGLSGEEAHVEGAGNKIHAPKSHGEGGGNSLYGLGSHVEGKHNEVAGFAVHAEGGWNFVGTNTPITQFSQTTSYNVGDVVGPNSVYVNFSDFTEQIVSQYLYRCITAPGQIQSGNGVEFITPVTWNSSTAYTTGTVVLYTTNTGIPLYYYANKDISAGVIPPISDSVGEGWQRIESILSPFKTTTSSGYYLLNADRMSSNVVAKVADGTTVQAMWEPIPAPKYTHVEGYRNIALGDYQHVGGKYNIADANKAVIIGNGVNNDGVIERSNAYTLDWNGNATFAGDITLGTTLSTSSQSIAAAINELYSNLGSEVSVSQIQHSGTKIAEITVDGSVTELFAPNGGGGGSTVVVEPVVQSGVNIADITVDGTTSHLYTPNAVGSVAVTQTQQSGTKIAEIDVDGTSTDLYAPTPTSVSVDDTLLTGTKVATITVDGVDTEILVPDAGDSVTVTQITSTGTHIADIEVDGVTTELYAPNAGGAIIDDNDIALDKTWSSYKINEMFFELAQRVAAIERYLWGQPVLTEDGDNRVTEDGAQRILEENEE